MSIDNARNRQRRGSPPPDLRSEQTQGLSTAEVALWAASASETDLRIVAQMIALRLGDTPVPRPVQTANNLWMRYAQEQSSGSQGVGSSQGTSSKTKSSTSIPKGESGSGFTRLPSGRAVKNQRPKARSLEETQARNWLERAQFALRDYVTGTLRAQPKAVSNNPPKGDQRYDDLVANLRWAQEYGYYTRVSLRDRPNQPPMGIEEWRRSNLRPTVLNGVILDDEEDNSGDYESSSYPPHRDNHDHHSDDEGDNRSGAKSPRLITINREQTA